jgi:hypothetical protein
MKNELLATILISVIWITCGVVACIMKQPIVMVTALAGTILVFAYF